MDIWILFSAVVPVFLFIVSLCVIFRIVPEKKSIGSMFVAAAVGALISCGVWIYMANWLHLSRTDSLVGFIYVTGIYIGCVMLFLLSVFSVFEASLTVWFLSHIARVPDGMQKNTLSKHYGVRQIVEKRIERLSTSGEIDSTDGRYMLGRKKSYFLFREDLFTLYFLFFPH